MKATLHYNRLIKGSLELSWGLLYAILNLRHEIGNGSHYALDLKLTVFSSRIFKFDNEDVPLAGSLEK